MKLVRARVQNYRSIVDSGTVDIEQGVTVLIGKNEQGKTNFLRGLASFNDDQRYSPGDLPNHLRPSLEDGDPTKIPIVTLWFVVEPQDRAGLTKIVDYGDSIIELACTRYYGNNYGYSRTRNGETSEPLKLVAPDIQEHIAAIEAIAEKLTTQLAAHAQRFPQFGANSAMVTQIINSLVQANFTDAAQVGNIVQTFATALRGLPSQDAPIQADIAAAVPELEAQGAAIETKLKSDPEHALLRQLPFFILHSPKTDHIPNEVKIADFAKDPNGTSKGMANLCRAAGLSMQKIQELASTADTSQREAYEDHYKGTISGGLNEFWTQEKYNVHFRIEKERLSVSISDGTYSPRIAPSDRSEGFQWYLSFYASLLTDMGVSRPTVLLLDNPALELHMDGQRDIKRFLEEKVTTNCQAVCVTHSPAMIDVYNLGQLRRVVMQGNNAGTKVLLMGAKEGSDFDLLEPVRSAIGASLAQSLAFNEWNVLVEGAADKPILDGALAVLTKDVREKVHVNGSLSETPGCFLPRFYQRARLPFVAVLDADSRGRELYADLKNNGITDDQIVRLDEILEDRQGDFALEDIVSAAFYYKAVMIAYPKQAVEQPADSDKKRARLYEEAFKAQHSIGFNKVRVADAAKKLLEQGQGDEESLTRLQRVVDAILNKLKAQVGDH